MKHKIFCSGCNKYFRLYVKNDKILSSELIQNMVSQVFIFGILALCIYGIYELDIYLKNCFDYNYKTRENGKYEFFILMLVLTFIMIWCTYLRFVLAFMKRNKLVWIEVQDYYNPDYHVTRNKAKKNMHLVYELTQKSTQRHTNRFDKYWYVLRSYGYIDGMT
jgi:hypothetical protein